MLLIFYKNLTKTHVFGVKMQFFSVTLPNYNKTIEITNNLI